MATGAAQQNAKCPQCKDVHRADVKFEATDSEAYPQSVLEECEKLKKAFKDRMSAFQTQYITTIEKGGLSTFQINASEDSMEKIALVEFKKWLCQHKHVTFTCVYDPDDNMSMGFHFMRPSYGFRFFK